MKIEEMISTNRADCSGCAACANICPKNAIVMTRDSEGFAYPKINFELCIKCGRCDKTCPALNFKKKMLTELPGTFTAIYDNDKILRHSSSGGAFTALSEIVLNDGGVVFGASFDKNWHVYHRVAQNFDELENLRGSKYVQSQIGDVYRQVREELKSKKVLFSGTPCQCAGLKNFLGGDHENLLTVEIICYGTPSPALWEYYIGEIGRRNEIAHVNFRSKRNGRSPFLEINFFDRECYINNLCQDIYGRCFFSNLNLRPSCYNCKFKFPNGQSDLVIGDAWGVQKFAPEMFDNRGVSVVFIYTAKGKNFFEQTNLKTRQVNFFKAVLENELFIRPACADERREDFFADFNKMDDKIAVMEKYYYQDNAEVSKRIKSQNRNALMKVYQENFEYVRSKFKRNVLILVKSLNSEAQKFLAESLGRNFQDRGIGIYIFNLTADRQFLCTEAFSLFTFEFKEDSVELADFAKKFNITEILVMNPIEWRSDVLNQWIQECGLPLNPFFR